MAIKNSQSKRMALANMLKQRPIYNQRMANFMSPASQQQAAAQAALGSQYIPSQDRNVLAAQAAQSSLSNIYNPSVQPTGPTGLTSNFYDPSYGIDRGFADQMTARNKAMQGMDSGQIQYDPVSKSFFSVGAMGQRGGPELQGTYDQMYRKYDVQNQLRGLGTPGSLTPMQQAAGAQAGTNPFNAAQIDFMNKNQDVFGGGSIKPMTSQDRNVLAAQAAQASQGGLSQPTQTQSVNPTQGQGQQYAQKNQFDFMSDLMSGQQQGAQQAAFMNNLMSGQPTQAQSVRPPLTGGAAVNRNKIQQPMPSTGLPKMNDTGFGNARGFNNNRVIPANMGQPKPLQSQAPATRPTNRGKLSQLAPTPGY